MRRLFAALALAVSVLHGNSQCTCSTSSSDPSVDNGSYDLVLEKGHWLAGLYGEARKFTVDGTSSEHQHHSNGSSSEMVMLQSAGIATADVRYGLSDRITLGMQLPWLRLVAAPYSATGLGDMNLTATWNFFRRNDLSAAIVLGLELPTGVRSDIGTETSTAIGSGSWDPIAGVNAVKSWRKSFLRAGVFYKYSTYGFEGVNYGSFVGHSLSYTYEWKEGGNCSSKDSSGTGSAYHINFFAAVNGEFSGQQFKSNNVFVSNTGGYILLAQLGTTFGHGKFSMPMSFSLPLFQTYNGMQSPLVYRVKIGFVRTF